MTFTDLSYAFDAGIAWIRIDRPAANNAVRGETMAELCDALDRATADAAVKTIVLGSTGRHFVAGADFAFLDGLSAMPIAQIKSQVYGRFQGAARRLYDCPKPTIAAVTGAAVTVGCELALCCDFRLATESAVFQESWIRLGLMPPLGGLKLLPALVGLAKAQEMVLLGTPVKGPEAERIGLIHRMLPSAEDLDAAVAELATQLAALPPTAYREVKAGLRRGLQSSMDQEWQTNLLAQASLIASDDFREGLAAVKERRPGRFSGG